MSNNRGHERMSYNQINDKAEDFISRYNPERIIPVKIDEILEFNLGMTLKLDDILERVYHVPAYLESNLTGICIDELIYKYNENRARFSIAHEIGHFILHRSRFENIPEMSLDEYIEYLTQRASQMRGEEDEANDFAGLILVPRLDLRRSFDGLIELTRSRGIEPYNMPVDFYRSALVSLSRKFKVSNQTMEIRIGRDRLWDVY